MQYVHLLRSDQAHLQLDRRMQRGYVRRSRDNSATEKVWLSHCCCCPTASHLSIQNCAAAAAAPIPAHPRCSRQGSAPPSSASAVLYRMHAEGMSASSAEPLVEGLREVDNVIRADNFHVLLAALRCLGRSISLCRELHHQLQKPFMLAPNKPAYLGVAVL